MLRPIKQYQSLASLPSTLEPNAIYYVKTGSTFTQYVTDDNAIAYPANAGGGGGGSGPNFSITHWKRTLTPAEYITVANAGVLNFSEVLTDAFKLGVSETNPAMALSISSPGPNGFIRPLFYGAGQKEKLDIRFSIGVVQNGTDFFRIRLNRVNPDPALRLINVFPISVDAQQVPEKIASFSTISYINTPADPFITSGFYFDFANDSSQTCQVASWDLLITRTWDFI